MLRIEDPFLKHVKFTDVNMPEAKAATQPNKRRELLEVVLIYLFSFKLYIVIKIVFQTLPLFTVSKTKKK